MKKSILLASILALATPMAMAHHTPEHSAESLQNTLAKDVKTAKMRADGAPVQLKGYLVKSLGDEKYLFKDRTDSITVKIDDDLMKNRKVNPKQAVTLIGEADVELENGLRRVTIDVDKIR